MQVVNKTSMYRGSPLNLGRLHGLWDEFVSYLPWMMSRLALTMSSHHWRVFVKVASEHQKLVTST